MGLNTITIDSEVMSDEFKTALREFLATKKNKRTRIEYLGYIKILCDKLAKKDFLDITEEDAATVFHNMQEKIHDGKLSFKTVCVRLSCYNSLSRFICNEYPELKHENVFRNIPRPSVDDKILVVKIPSLQELDQIMTVAKKTPMYYLILALSTRCGLAASNIVKLTKSNLVESGSKKGIYLPNEENKKKCISIIIPEDVEAILDEYLKNLTTEDEQGHLFYNKNGNPITLKNLSDNIGGITQAAGVSHRYTLKDMRARAIMDMVDAGVAEETVRDYMGLGSMRTRQFFEAKGALNGCPAELVNYRLVT